MRPASVAGSPVCCCPSPLSWLLFFFLAFGNLPAPIGKSFADFLLCALVCRFVIALLRAKIVLGHKMSGVIMAVFISLTVTESGRALIMGISQMFRYRECSSRAHIGKSRIDSGDRSIALMGCGNVDRSLRNRDARLRPPDEFRSLVSCIGQNQGHGIGQSDIFRGANDDAARDKPGVFTGLNHLGQ